MILNRRETELAQLDIILRRLQGRKAPVIQGQLKLDKVSKVEKTITSLNQRIRKLRARITRLSAEAEIAQQATILVQRRLYPNVQISLNGHMEEVMEERGRSEIHLQGEKIKY